MISLSLYLNKYDLLSKNKPPPFLLTISIKDATIMRSIVVSLESCLDVLSLNDSNMKLTGKISLYTLRWKNLTFYAFTVMVCFLILLLLTTETSATFFVRRKSKYNGTMLRWRIRQRCQNPCYSVCAKTCGTPHYYHCCIGIKDCKNRKTVKLNTNSI